MRLLAAAILLALPIGLASAADDASRKPDSAQAAGAATQTQTPRASLKPENSDIDQPETLKITSETSPARPKKDTAKKLSLDASQDVKPERPDT